MDEKLRADRFFVSGMEILTDLIASASERAEADEQAGNLLADLERRQDDVLVQLDELDRRVSDLLRGLGVTLIEDSEAIEFVVESDEDNDSNARVEVAAAPTCVATLPANSETQGTKQESAGEITVGFSKLPKGDSKSHRGKRVKAAFGESTAWQQTSRAA